MKSRCAQVDRVQYCSEQLIVNIVGRDDWHADAGDRTIEEFGAGILQVLRDCNFRYLG